MSASDNLWRVTRLAICSRCPQSLTSERLSSYRAPLRLLPLPFSFNFSAILSSSPTPPQFRHPYLPRHLCGAAHLLLLLCDICCEVGPACLLRCAVPRWTSHHLLFAACSSFCCMFCAVASAYVGALWDHPSSSPTAATPATSTSLRSASQRTLLASSQRSDSNTYTENVFTLVDGVAAFLAGKLDESAGALEVPVSLCF